jgi:hypothetical protein
MSESTEWTDDGEAWIVDTGVFVACGREGSQKFEALRRFAVSRELVFVIPQRVYEELGGAPDGGSPEQTPVDSAVDGGWVRVAADLDYTDGTVASVMDTVRSYIANSSNRPEDEIEKADAALAGVAVQLLGRVYVSSVRVVTTDQDAGEGAVTALEAHRIRRANRLRGWIRIS